MSVSPRIFHSLEEARLEFGPCALTIGNFDGVHLGHQRLLREVAHLASSKGLKCAALTFHPHPTRVIAPARSPKLVSTIEQRARWMAECGIEHVCVLPFTREVAALDPDQFASQVLVDSLQARVVVVGNNFRFGRGQAGTTDTLRTLGERYGFDARPMGAVLLRNVIVSSSEIRRQLLSGNVVRAARMLGRFYTLEGAIVKGHGIGAKQTVPTLNMDATQEVIPATGVYVTATTDLDRDRFWTSVTNIGYRPTFGGDQLSIETFLLDPLDDPAPERIRVELTHRLREERKFESVEALRAQILRDVYRAQRWHRRFAQAARLAVTPRPPAILKP
ncbi:MAG: bifunctional riboflavin kinase/FAD synthetase [Acidobacteria bacterium]|nr:bifunctional riboflavin kinase/FAD synthetase [Acidobacteriota bacterium]